MKEKLGIYHKLLIFIYIIAIPIPFGICLLLFIYSILFYIFKLPLKKERELLKFMYNKVKEYINKKDINGNN